MVGARILGWSVLLLGAGHLITVALELLRVPDQPTQRAFEALSLAKVSMPGPQRNLEQLFWGYSLLMGLMVIAFGATVIWAAGQIRESLRPLLWLGGAFSLLGLIISAMLMPIPPIVGLSVALLGAVVGLTDRGDRTRA